MINRSCTCSREPLMALNLHQARGEWKRKSREERQPASRYTLNLQPHSAGGSDSSSHTHVELGDEAQPKTPRTPGPSKTQHANFIPQLSFISNALHFRPFFHSALPCTMPNLGSNTLSQHRTHSNL